MIARRAVLCLGMSQLVCWGITYYLIGGFGEAIASDLGWSREIVHGGFALALLVMGLVSPPVGRAIDRHGGAPVMTAGSIVRAMPGFVLSAAAPVIYALVIRSAGEQGAFLMSAVLAAIMVGAAVALAMSFAPRGAAGQEARVDPSPSPSRSPR